MHSLETIRRLNEEAASKRREELNREPIKLRPDKDSIRNPVQSDTAWECELETECYVNDGNWLSTLKEHLSEATPAQRAWLEEAALTTALQPLLALSGYAADTTRLDITFVRGDQHKEGSWKSWATRKVRLTKKSRAENTHPSTKRIVIDYSSGVLQPRFHDLHARQLVNELTGKYHMEVPTSGIVIVHTVPLSLWLLFTQEEQQKILSALGLEHASLTVLVAAFFYDPEISANVHRDRMAAPNIVPTDKGESWNLDDHLTFTGYYLHWGKRDPPEISRCGTTFGTRIGFYGRSLLLREKTRI